jgi:serine/threonine protein kinase/tetratricopeptide (TPR) repeat protein
MQDSKSGPGGEVPKKPLGTGVGTRFPGESSGSGVPLPTSEVPTSDASGHPSDPAMTVADVGPPDADATLVDAAAPSHSNATALDARSPFPSGSQTRRASPPPTSLNSGMPSSTAVFRVGEVLNERYEILQLLGEGGMGAVYKAADRELDRFVALKVIRPELASNPSMLARFKQELLLAHQVTHRNVIRIYDLAEADGVKFITMEFVEGKDLRTLIRERKKFPPEEAVEIAQQVCLALDAAHSVGVIHRDLKPQNIMLDNSGRVLVMDFGLARTLEGDGMTQTGAIVGTMEYMSPEQALAKELDQRSDLFALGLILYEMLTGKTPFKAESALASLIKRTQERAVPVSDIDNQIPGALSGIVSKCLERDLDQRYQSAKSVLADLNTWKDKRAAGTINFDASVKPWGQTIPWPLVTGILTALVLAIGGYMLRDRLFKPSPNPASAVAVHPVSLAILPFQNASGDSKLDWLGSSLADMLSTDVGQSARLRTVSSANLHQIFSDLRISSGTALDPATIRRVADFSNADRVVWGQYARFGDQIRIDATLLDIKSGGTVPLKIDVPSEKEIPGAVDRLAESIRQKLALPDDVLKELKASSFQPSSKSIDALRDYNQGIESQRDGRNLEAQKHFENATKEDPAFALAFSRLAQTYGSLGYDSEAEQSAKRAVALNQDLPAAEKYLISAIELQVIKNYPEAINAYENLAKVMPGSSDVQSALAGLYQDSGDLVKARDYYQRLLSSNPKDVAATLNLGRIEIKSGNPQGSFDPLNRAYSLAIQVDNEEQKATSLHLMAVAYRMLNKPQEVLQNEQQALKIWREIGQKRGLAFSLNEMAKAQTSLGDNKDALSNFQEALQIRRGIGDKRGLGDTLIDMGNFSDDRGDHDEALKMYKEALQIERDIGNESLQAICLNNIGAAYFEKAQYEDARTYYQQALQLREKSKVPQDIVESIHNLAETSLRMGQYNQAVAEYMRALDLRRSMNDTRGAAIESYTVGMMFDYQGRFGAAIDSKQEALKTFLGLQDKTNWMADISGGYGESLVLAGRGSESQPYFEEALILSRELKNNSLISQTLAFQGDAAYYRGNLKSAADLYQQALQTAVKSKEPDRVLTAKVRLAKVAVQSQRASQVIRSLRQLMQQSDEQGVAHISLECAVSLAEALIQTHDYANAQQELERALLRADNLGLKPLSVVANYQLAVMLRATGHPADAQQHYRQAQQLLEAMLKEPGADKILQRADFKMISDEAARSAKLAAN